MVYLAIVNFFPKMVTFGVGCYLKSDSSISRFITPELGKKTFSKREI